MKSNFFQHMLLVMLVFFIGMVMTATAEASKKYDHTSVANSLKSNHFDTKTLQRGERQNPCERKNDKHNQLTTKHLKQVYI